MAKVRRLNVSRVEGNGANDNNTNEIRPYGDIGLYQGDYIETIQEDRLELLIFDGVRTHEKSKVLSPGIFYGSGADSGDGAGLDTIKLIPDAVLHRNFGSYGNDQYIVIDPTTPNHIHVRAGGLIDQSNAELFLGGELNHVRVSDSSNNVAISTDDGLGGTSNWTFNSSGTLTLSSSGNIQSPEHMNLDANYDSGYSIYIGNNHPTPGMLGGVLIGDNRGGFVDIQTTKFIVGQTAVPASSLGSPGDIAGQVAFDSSYIYYCTANYNQTGHQVTVATAWDSATALNTNQIQLTQTTDTLQIAVGDIISDSDGGATSIVESISSDGTYTYVGTGSFAYDCVFPLTFTSTDYVPGGNIWKRQPWANDTW